MKEDHNCDFDDVGSLAGFSEGSMQEGERGDENQIPVEAERSEESHVRMMSTKSNCKARGSEGYVQVDITSSKVGDNNVTHGAQEDNGALGGDNVGTGPLNENRYRLGSLMENLIPTSGSAAEPKSKDRKRDSRPGVMKTQQVGPGSSCKDKVDYGPTCGLKQASGPDGFGKNYGDVGFMNSRSNGFGPMMDNLITNISWPKTAKNNIGQKNIGPGVMETQLDLEKGSLIEDADGK